LAMTRELTFQLYLMPYLSAGTYQSFYLVTDAHADAFDDRFVAVGYDGDDRFSFGELRSNAVVRWEYAPGSTAFLVYAHDQTFERDDLGLLSIPRDVGELWGATSHDVIMVKLAHALALL